MKKVLLINTNTEKAPYPVPPLGLCLLAKQIERNFDISIYDGAPDNGHGLSGIIKKINPDYIGISIRNIDNVTMGRVEYYLPNIIKNFIQVIRSQTRSPVILGGSGFSIFPEEIMEETGIEYGITGEGEVSFAQLLEALEHGTSLENIPGVIYRTKNGYCSNPPAYSMEMDGIPFSRIYEQINYSPYKERGSYPIQTKRGCVYQCVYCSYPCLEGRSYRLRIPKEVVDEIQDAHIALGDVLFEIVDSTFNSPSDYAEAICQEIIKRNMKIRLRTMGINPGDATERILLLMKVAGFMQIDCTPDTASPKMLRTMRKNFTLDTLKSCADLIRKHDIPTMWFFIFGGPGETVETVCETFSFIDNHVSQKDMVLIGEGIRILPRTELYDIAVKQNIIRTTDSILEPVFYVNPDIGRKQLSETIRQEITKRNNAVHALDSVPKKEMIEEAIAIRKTRGLQEPMFRTLLRLKSKYTG